MFISLISKLLIVSSISLNDSQIFISDSTPVEIFQYFPVHLLINLDKIPLQSLPGLISELKFLFLIDLTFSSSYTEQLNFISSSINCAYLSLMDHSSSHKNRVKIHLSTANEFKLILSLFQSLKINSFTVLSSSSPADMSLAEKFEKVQGADVLFYSDQINSLAADSLVLKILKTKAVKFVLIIDSSPSFAIIEHSLISKRWAKSGVVLIYSTRCFSQYQIIGALKVVQEGTLMSRNIFEYHFDSIIKFLQVVGSKLGDNGDEVNKERFLIVAKEILYPGMKLANFRSGLEIIGDFDVETGNLILEKMILFPGNKTSFNIEKSFISLSIANGTHDPYYSGNYAYMDYLYKGAELAVFNINQQSLIENFELKLLPTDCGIFWYEAYWYYSCFAPKVESFGIGLVTTLFGESVKGNIKALRSLGKVVPNVSPFGADSETDSKELYPELVKLEARSTIFYASGIVMLRSLGYKDIVIIATNESIAYFRYEMYKSIIEQSGMRIANDENSRFINWNYHRDNFTLYKDIFYSIRKTRCTVFVILIADRAMAIEALYDVGYRQGELIFIANLDSLSFLIGVPEIYANKRRELVTGSLIFSYREFIGDYGSQIKNELEKFSQQTNFMCLTYDSVLVFKEAINYLITRGGDFEEYEEMMNVVRMNRFVGCLGNVFFDSAGNTRSSAQILVQQTYYNQTEDNVRTVDVAFYDRFSSLLIYQIAPYTWPGGKMPENFIGEPECGFKESLDQESQKGKHVLYGLCVGLAVVALVSGTFSIYYFRNKKFESVDRAIITFEDQLFYCFFFLEFFQFLAMGPDQIIYKKIINNINLFASFEFNEYFQLKFERFWTMFYIILASCMLWIVLLLLKYFRFENMLNESFKNLYHFISRIYLLVVGHFLLLPNVSMVSNIFLCHRGKGEDLTDSYLQQDCQQSCYTGHHIVFAILAYTTLVFYISIAVFIRPAYQESSSSLHIYTKPYFLTIESLLHISLVTLNKTLKMENQTTHGIVILIMLIVFTCFTFIIKPYNIKRPLILHLGFLVGSIWAILISTIFHDLNSVKEWIIVEIVGLFFIMILRK